MPPINSELVSLDHLAGLKCREPLQLICRHCEIQFSRAKNKILAALRNGNSIYCSSGCYLDWVEAQRIKVQCHNCKSEFRVKPKEFTERSSGRFFCNHSCSAAFNNVTRVRKRSRKPGVCIVCDGGTRESKDYCSSRCYHDKQWKIRTEQIEAFGGFDKENRPLARKYLIAKDGHRCSLCGVTEWAGQSVPLVCDHIDGNSENNLLCNLRMVCQNCNALLSTFGSRNRGNGRKSKREEYHKNKHLWKD